MQGLGRLAAIGGGMLANLSAFRLSDLSICWEVGGTGRRFSRARRFLGLPRGKASVWGCDELTTLRGWALPCCWVVRVAVYRRGKKKGAEEGMRGGVITECAGLGGGERRRIQVGEFSRSTAGAGWRLVGAVIALCSHCRVLSPLQAVGSAPLVPGGGLPRGKGGVCRAADTGRVQV